MTKKETFKWVVQIIASIATAILTAMGTTSCMGYLTRKASWSYSKALWLYYLFWPAFFCPALTIKEE